MVERSGDFFMNICRTQLVQHLNPIQFPDFSCETITGLGGGMR